MSARSRDLPRRSCLSTPGSNEKFLAKAPTVPADMTFLDLEDAVAPLEKESARPKVVDAIKNLPWDERVLCVRVNAWDTEWTYGDVIEVVGNAGERLDEVMLPKVQSAAEVKEDLGKVPAGQNALLLIWSNGGNSFRVLHPMQG